MQCSAVLVLMGCVTPCLTDVNGKLPILPMRVYLLHKMEEVDRAAGILHELGGTVAEQALEGVVAVHATCYEKSTKLLGE